MPDSDPPRDANAPADESRTEFERLAEEKPLSLLQEFFIFIRENEAWWMVPILVVLTFLGALALLAGTGAAPFIYTLF